MDRGMSASGGEPRPAFVGRQAELQSLADAHAAIRSGGSRTIVVEGDAGIGKSSLVSWFLREVANIRLVRADCDEGEVDLPWGLLDQLLTAAQRPPAAGTHGRRDHLAAGAELLSALTDLVVAGPVLVLVEDAHWADQPSLRALTFALRRLTSDAVLTVVTIRPEAVLPAGLRRLASADRGATVRLDGLEVVDVRRLAAEIRSMDLPMAAAARLTRHTQGNPLYVRALLDDLDASQLRHDSPDLPVPRSYALVIISRLAECSRQARELLAAAAVLGNRSSLSLSGAIADLDDLTAAVEEACSCGMLQRGPVAEDLAVFSHPLVRAAIYGDLSLPVRARLHNAAAEQLIGAAALHHRVAATIGKDEALADDLAKQADDEAAAGWIDAAAHHLADSARLSTVELARERRLLVAVRLFTLNGDATHATELAPEVAALPDGAHRRFVLGYLSVLAGHRTQGEQLIRSAWDGVDPAEEPDLAAQIGAELSHLAFLDGRPEDGVQWAERAYQSVDQDPSRAVGLRSRYMVALALSGRPEQGLELAAGLPDVAGHQSPADVDGLVGRALIRMWMDDLPAAYTDFSSVARQLHQWRVLRDGVIAQTYLSEVEYRLGRWDDSIVHGDLAVSLARDSDQVWLLPFSRATVVGPLAGRGMWSEAEAHLSAAQDALRSGEANNEADIGYVSYATAQLAAAKGDPAGVVAAVEPIRTLPNGGGVSEPGTIAWQHLYIDALLDLGRVSEASESLGPMFELAAARQRQSSLATAWALRGRVTAAGGHSTATWAAFEAAVAHAERAGSPFLTARVLHAFGRELRRAGDRRAAAERLRQAGALFTELGAEPDGRRNERELAACGLAPLRSTTPAPLRLTAQELATAKLVASGLTNREVAAELVISVKTVEYHLANVFAKLGVRNRRAIPGALGLDPLQ